MGVALAVCAAVLIATRMLLAQGIDGGLIEDHARRGDIFSVAARLAQVQAGSVDTLLLGTSRFHSALLPRVWEQSAGLAGGAVERLVANGAQLWDHALILREGGGVPASVRDVVVELSPWEFNANFRNTVTRLVVGLPEHFRASATLGERWRGANDRAVRIALVGDWIWPIHLRRPFDEWIHDFSHPTVLRPSKSPIWYYHRSPQAERTAATRPAFQGAQIAQDHFNDPEISAFGRLGLDQLLEQVLASDARITFVQLPFRLSYVQAIHQDDRRRLFYEEVHALFRSEEGPRISVWIFENAEDLGLREDEILLDYGHFSLRGARALTRKLARKLAAARLDREPAQ